jgi:hypothetical protein
MRDRSTRSSEVLWGGIPGGPGGILTALRAGDCCYSLAFQSAQAEGPEASCAGQSRILAVPGYRWGLGEAGISYLHIHGTLLHYFCRETSAWVDTSMPLLQMSPPWPLSKSRLVQHPLSARGWRHLSRLPMLSAWLGLAYLACLDLSTDPKFQILNTCKSSQIHITSKNNINSTNQYT